MKKLITFLGFLCALNVLMIVGLAGFLLGTGRLDRSKLQTIGDILRVQGAPRDLRTQVHDIMVASAVAPAATTTTAGGMPDVARQETRGAAGAPATAAERIDYVRRLLEEESLRLDARAQDLRRQQELLVRQQAQLELRFADLRQRQEAFENQLATVDVTRDDAGFSRALTLFEELKPKQVKDLLSSMPPNDVVRFFNAMEPDRAAKVMAEFRTPDEKAFLTDIVNRLRRQEAANGTGAALGGGQAGAAWAVSAAVGTPAASTGR